METILKNRIIICFLAIITQFSCNTKFIAPLKDSKLMTADSLNPSYVETTLFFEPGGDLEVRSLQNGKVDRVMFIDSAYMIVTSGRYSITYGNLATASVKTGDIIRKKQVIGRVAISNANRDNKLALGISDLNGRRIMVNDFRR